MITEDTRDTSKHRYEVVKIIDGAHKYPHLIVGDYVDTNNGEKQSVTAAIVILMDTGNAAVDRVAVYHTHPSPGPVRRYVGTVDRNGKLVRPA